MCRYGHPCRVVEKPVECQSSAAELGFPRSWSGAHRKTDFEASAATRCYTGRNGSTVGLSYRFDECKPEPSTPLVARSGILEAYKSGEDTVAMFLRYPGAIVFDSKDRFVFVLGKREHHAARGVPSGIVNKIPY
jgi:hypothetical protein